jgi:hypothetical protein
MCSNLGLAETRRDWYYDHEGSERLVVARFDGNGKKEFRPFHRSASGWIAKDPPGKLPLFNLPALIARPSEPAYIVEGEKCACELATLKVLVTTSAHGSKAPHKTDWTPLAGREVVILPDNDQDGRAYAQKVFALLAQLHPPCRVSIVQLPNLPPKGDCVEWLALRDAQLPDDIRAELDGLVSATAGSPDERKRAPRIRFYQPSELRDYKPETDIVLVGDCHVMRGEIFVIGGEPGVGKSLSATNLARCGATGPGATWFGMPILRQFRTMIIQTENGKYRLQQEFGSLSCEDLDDWIRISEPPPFGLTLSNAEFQEDVRAALTAFKPECVILDPWNSAARDDKQKDYFETFEALRQLLPTGPDKPALGIVAHTRKPATNEKRTGGTGLMHLLAGSHILASSPRSLFVMIRGSEDETDESVVWCNPKNNNGALAPRTAWYRRRTGFESATDFDWKEFEKPVEKRVIVRLEDIAAVFKGGGLELKEAAHALASQLDINEGSAYNALKADGKFAAHLSRRGKLVEYRP